MTVSSNPWEQTGSCTHLPLFGMLKAATQHCLSIEVASVFNYGRVLSWETSDFHSHISFLAWFSHCILPGYSHLASGVQVFVRSFYTMQFFFLTIISHLFDRHLHFRSSLSFPFVLILLLFFSHTICTYFLQLQLITFLSFPAGPSLPPSLSPFHSSSFAPYVPLSTLYLHFLFSAFAIFFLSPHCILHSLVFSFCLPNSGPSFSLGQNIKKKSVVSSHPLSQFHTSTDPTLKFQPLDSVLRWKSIFIMCSGNGNNDKSPLFFLHVYSSNRQISYELAKGSDCEIKMLICHSDFVWGSREIQNCGSRKLETFLNVAEQGPTASNTSGFMWHFTATCRHTVLSTCPESSSPEWGEMEVHLKALPCRYSLAVFFGNTIY